MANINTFRLAEFAQSIGVQISDLLITCFHCNKWLTENEKILFEYCNLLLYWKNGLPYACCPACIKTSARVDFLRGFQRTVTWSQFAEVCSYPWESVPVRCLGCFRLLNDAEKREIEANNLVIYCVKEGFRSPCVLCRIGL